MELAEAHTGSSPMRRWILLYALVFPTVAAAAPETPGDWLRRGAAYFRQGRYLEASIAYMTVHETWPEHLESPAAVKYALAASRRAIAQFGESPADPTGVMVRHHRQLLEHAPDGAPCAHPSHRAR